MFTFECLKFGKFALRSGPHGSFEILLLVSPNAGRSIASVEVDKEDVPALTLRHLQPRERLLPARSTATVESVTLASHRDETPTDFELTANGTGDGLEIVLSGHCGFHLFWWRLNFELNGEEVIVHGPFLADSPAS